MIYLCKDAEAHLLSMKGSLQIVHKSKMQNKTKQEQQKTKQTLKQATLAWH